jgi:RNA polymerase sigma-70 factor (ECF subfamily)
VTGAAGPPGPASTSSDDRFDGYLSAAIHGDRGAVDYILRIIRPLVLRYCRVRLGRTTQTYATADDVAREVCMAVLTTLSGYRDQGRPFLAFVYGIAAHKVTDAQRQAQRNKSEPVADVPDNVDISASAEQHVLLFESTSGTQRLLEMLTDKEREILILRVVNGLSSEETAQAVGSTAGAVRIAQHRALARLRGVMREDRQRRRV